MWVFYLEQKYVNIGGKIMQNLQYGKLTKHSVIVVSILNNAHLLIHDNLYYT